MPTPIPITNSQRLKQVQFNHQPTTGYHGLAFQRRTQRNATQCNAEHVNASELSCNLIRAPPLSQDLSASLAVQHIVLLVFETYSLSRNPESSSLNNSANDIQLSAIPRSVDHDEFAWNIRFHPAAASERVAFAPAFLQHDPGVVRVEIHVHAAVAMVNVADLASASGIDGLLSKQGEAFLLEA